MKQVSILFLLLTAVATLHSQQLYLEAFSGFNKTAYDPDLFKEKQTYTQIGLRLAGGADHFQVGGEVRSNLSDPSFSATGQGTHEETYYGAFLRGKISRYPAMRFGLVLRAGAGFYDYKVNYGTLLPEVDYDPILGFNGGLGFSIPAFKVVMLELGYTYNYVERPEINDQPYKSSYHSFQAGLSLNFVFGERARNYRHLRDNWRWRDGWRG